MDSEIADRALQFARHSAMDQSFQTADESGTLAETAPRRRSPDLADLTEMSSRGIIPMRLAEIITSVLKSWDITGGFVSGLGQIQESGRGHECCLSDSMRRRLLGR